MDWTEKLAPSTGTITVSFVIFMFFLETEAETASETMAVLERQTMTANSLRGNPVVFKYMDINLCAQSNTTYDVTIF